MADVCSCCGDDAVGHGFDGEPYCSNPCALHVTGQVLDQLNPEQRAAIAAWQALTPAARAFHLRNVECADCRVVNGLLVAFAPKDGK